MFGMLIIKVFLDIKILILTFYKVALRKDIVPKNKGAMEEFLGNK